MKILIIVRILWPGGVQRIAFAEAEGLMALGNETDLIFIRDTGRFRYPVNIKFTAIHNSKVKKRVAAKFFRFVTGIYIPQRGDDAMVDIDLIWNYVSGIQQHYDIVYCFDEFIGLFAGPLRRHTGARIVTLIHEAAFENDSFLPKLVQKFAMSCSDAILTNSARNLEILQKHGYANSFEVYPGLNKRWTEAENEREDTAISVTLWDQGRHPEVLLDVAKYLTVGRILLVGDWADHSYMESIQNRIERDGLKDRISLTGPVTEEYLNSLYRRCKVSIRFGYDEKGPGMGSLESISYGIPIIFNDGIGIKEVLRDGENGFLVDIGDKEGIAEKIGLLFTNNQKWSSMHENNISLSENLTWEKHNALLNAIFKSVLKGIGKDK